MFEQTTYSQNFLVGCMIALAVIIFFCLIRGILGPRFTDRIMAANMIGTKSIVFVCILAAFLEEGFLADVGLIYAMLSFLAVVVLSKIIVLRERVARERKIEKIKLAKMKIVDRSEEEEAQETKRETLPERKGEVSEL